MTLPISFTFCRNTTDLKFVSNHSFAYPSGNAILFECLEGIEPCEPIYLDEGYCLDEMSTSRHGNLIAIACHGHEPVINVYKFPDNTLVGSLTCEGGLDRYRLVSVSEHGSRCVSISDVPESKLHIWDIPSQRQLTCRDLDLDPPDIQQIMFDPVDHSVFFTSTRHSIIIWQLTKNYGEYGLQSRTWKLPDPEPGESITSQIWDASHRVIFATSTGRVFTTTSSTSSTGVPDLIYRTTDQSAITSLAHTRYHLLLGEKGSITILEIGVTYKRIAALDIPVTDSRTIDSPITSISFFDTYQFLAVMDSSGRLFSAAFHPDSLKESANSEHEPIRLRLVRRWNVASHPNPSEYQSALLNSGEHALIWNNDGLIQIWDLRQQLQLTSISVHKNITALHTTYDNRLLFVGHDKNCLSIFDIRLVRQPRLIKYHKLHCNGAIKSVRSNINNSVTSVISETGEIYIINCNLDLVAVSSVSGPVLSSSWTSNKTQLLISNNCGELHAVTLPDEMFTSPTSSLNDEQLASNGRTITAKSQFVGLSLSTLMWPLTSSSSFYAICLDRSLKRFIYNATTSMAEEAEILSTHELVSCIGNDHHIALSESNDLIASCNTDGAIILRYGHNYSRAITIAAHNSDHGGALSVSLCSSSSILLTAGADGAVFSFHIPDSVKSLSNVITKGPPQLLISLINEDTLNSMPTISSNSTETQVDASSTDQVKEKTEIEDNRIDVAVMDQIKSRLFTLKETLTDVISTNESCSAIEKLDIDELIIDKTLEAEELHKSALQLKRVQREIEHDKLRYEMLCERVKNTTWDSMDVKEMSIASLQATMSVNNFPIIQRSQHTMLLRERILFLRQMQILERNFLSDELDPTGGFQPDRLIHSAGYIFEYGVTDPELADRQTSVVSGTEPTDKSLKSSNAVKASDSNSAATNSAALPPSLATQRTGFHPVTLWSEQKKIMQVVLIEIEIEKLRHDFNAEIQSLYNIRQGEVEKIEELRKTILDVSSELGINCDPNAIAFVRDQPDPSSVLQVQDSEITAPLTLSKTQMEKKRREEEEIAKADAARKADNVTERALKEMMNGTLESKRGLSSLSAEIEKPKFIENIPEASWTEEEKQIAASYVERCNSRAQERDTRKKQLEALLKKSRNDVSDILRNFDERIEKARTKRLKVHGRILLLELCMIQLQNELLAIENKRHQLSLYDKTMEDLQTKKQDVANSIATLRRNLDSLQKQHEQTHSDLRQAEKYFRKDFADAGPLVETLFKWFRNKKMLGAAPNLSHNPSTLPHVNNLDPFAGRDDRARSDGANIDNDIQSWKPAELSVAVWDRFVEKRGSRLSQEQILKGLIQDMEAMEQRIDWLESQQAQIQVQIKDLSDRKEKSYLDRALALLNTIVMIKAKQGQVEVDESPLITDLKDCQLIDRSIVEKFNEKVIELGKDKVATLREITEFRKGINMLMWSKKSYDLTLQEYQAQITEFQTLRVTKALQELIKVGGHETRHANEIDHLQQKTTFLSNINMKKVSEFKRVLHKLKKKIHLQQSENDHLNTVVKELQEAVANRSQIIGTRHANGESESIAKKMKALSLRRNLIDLVHVQSSEIDFLRKDLENMRKKIFPSFKNHTRKQRKRLL